MTKNKIKIVTADMLFDGSIAVFWDRGRWKNTETEILVCSTINGDYRSIGKTKTQCCRIKEPEDVEYVKLIVKNEDGELFITEPKKINDKKNGK